MKKILPLLFSAALFSCQNSADEITGNSNLLTAIGRYENTPDGVKMYSAGGYFTFAFQGKNCELTVLNDGDFDHSFLDLIVDDDKPQKFRVGRGDTTFVITKKDDKLHHVMLCRDSETMMSFTQIKKVKADKISAWTPETSLKIEFIGNSITSGCDCDTSLVSQKDYQWGDWHRAYYAYGPQTARNLNAQYSLASVSGIGLIHSCCDNPFTMPQIYDNVKMRYDTIPYDFSFKPDLICCCLGQNDGIQDNETFISAYTAFVKMLKEKNPSAKNIVLLNSPMANDSLNTWLQEILPQVVDRLTKDGVTGVKNFELPHNKNAGGSMHPDILQHGEIAKELTEFLKKEVL
ncbi:MAG: hypothetical protein II956_01920 [Bacteroidales bacterium]|nr:hypothetical protein [Bacteroidales bacterium]